MPFLLLYLTKHLLIPAPKAAMIFWVYGTTALILSTSFGWLADRYGAEKMMIISQVGFSLVLGGFFFVDTFFQAMVLSFFMALTGEAFRPAVMAAIATHASIEQRKVALAFHRLAINAGMSLGPLLGGFIVQYSFQAIFLVDAVTSLVAAVVLIVYLLPLAPRTTKAIVLENTRGSFRGAFSDRSLLYFTCALLPVSMVFFQHESSMSIYMTQTLGFSESWYGMVFTINTLMIIFIELPLNIYTSHWSNRFAMSLGCMFFALGFGSLVFGNSVAHIFASVGIWTFGEMILFPTMANYVTTLAPKGSNGMYMGFFAMSFSLAFILGPWLGTNILTHFGPSVLWISCFFAASISALMMLRVKTEGRTPTA